MEPNRTSLPPVSPFDHPLFAAALAFAVGCVAGRIGDADPGVTVVALALFVYLLLDRTAIGPPALLIFALAGVGAITLHDAHPPHPTTTGKVARVTVDIEAVESVRPHTVRYNARIVDGQRVRLYLRKERFPELYLPGDRIAFTRANVKPVRGFGNIGQFDYEAYQADRDIAGALFVDRWGTATVVERRFHWRRPLEMVKNRMRSRLTFADDAVTGVAQATLLGDTGMIAPAVRDAFARSGLAHLLAVSGMHVGFVAGAAFVAARLIFFVLFRRLRPRWLESGGVTVAAAGVALLVATAYGLMTGPRFPSNRATIMVGVYLLALMSGRGRHFIGAFSLALLLILAFDPWALFDAGFQLSFTAVFFISIFLTGYVNGRLLAPVAPDEPIPPWWRRAAMRAPWLTGVIGVSLFAGIGTAPLAAYHFNVVPVWSLPLNIAATPVAGVAVPWGLVAGAAGGDYPIAGAEFLVGLLTAAALRVGEAPSAGWTVPAFPASALAIFYLLLMTLAGLFRLRRTKPAAAILAALLLAVLAIRPITDALDTAARFRFLDVGQGLSVAVTWPEKGALIIDGGPTFATFDTGRMVLAPVFFDAQRTRLSLMVATHGDADHAGALPGLARTIPPAVVADNGYPDEGRSLAALRAWGAGHGVGRVFRAGERLDLPGGMGVEILSPPDDPAFPPDDNNRSVVTRLTYAGVRVLVVGDLSRAGEKWLLTHGVDLAADVLSVGHHGSDTSSSAAFLKAVGAKTAVISVGYDNRWGFPSQAVLARLAHAGMRVLRTDERGEVRLTVEGGDREWAFGVIQDP